MRYTHTCPKCRASSIARVPGGSNAYGAGNYIPVGLTTFSAVPIARYLCLNCGYVENWVDNPADLVKLRQKYGQPPAPQA
ncbi:hypothetical protein AB0H83_35675 [Dactylosporangium sp. NPDC050688]|uniref:hypothetical protein n=1 Tax=Dactylosporangium sp. NPDC050688 TaxID=3157217 RepID=UPI0034059512